MRCESIVTSEATDLLRTELEKMGERGARFTATPDMKVDLEKIETLVEPVALSIGCELVACEWVMESGRATLRVLIDKPGGILVEDCERLSYLLDPLLDVEDLIPQRY